MRTAKPRFESVCLSSCYSLAPANEAEALVRPFRARELRPRDLLRSRDSVDHGQFLARDEDAVRILAIPIEDDPMLDVSLVRSGQREDRETLVESGCDLLEGEVMLLADSDTIGTEAANKLLYLKPVIRIWIALLEEFVEAGIGMEGVQDCGTGSIAACVRFNLAIALNVQRAYVVGTGMPKGLRDQTNARRSGKGIKSLRSDLCEVKHRFSEIYNGRIKVAKKKANNPPHAPLISIAYSAPAVTRDRPHAAFAEEH